MWETGHIFLQDPNNEPQPSIVCQTRYKTKDDDYIFSKTMLIANSFLLSRSMVYVFV